jgi:hypothetical protein
MRRYGWSWCEISNTWKIIFLQVLRAVYRPINKGPRAEGRWVELRSSFANIAVVAGFKFEHWQLPFVHLAAM